MMHQIVQVSFVIFNLITISSCIHSDENVSKAFLAETLPKELLYEHNPVQSKSTPSAWLHLIDSAQSSIEIASMYWSMLGDDVMPDSDRLAPESRIGKQIIDSLIESAKKRSVTVRIAVNDEKSNYNNTDLNLLKPYARIRFVNFKRLIGAGILHTKFIIIDQKHFYLGSANMDWRSLTHVKELGIVIENDSRLSADLLRIFEIYWYLGDSNASIPNHWPSNFDAFYNVTNPYRLQIDNNQGEYNVFLTSSPRQLCSDSRTNDLDSILQIINEADKFVYISVMDYFPLFLYEKKRPYWPIIDNALRRAVWEKHVQVRLLASHWNHTRPYMRIFLKSLQSLNDKQVMKGAIETRLFTFPGCPFKSTIIPFAEVNHNKYMITDKSVYIGTSNWSADYFVSTGGVGIILNVTNVDDHQNRQQLFLYNQTLQIFLRDWNSKYAKAI